MVCLQLDFTIDVLNFNGALIYICWDSNAKIKHNRDLSLFLSCYLLYNVNPLIYKIQYLHNAQVIKKTTCLKLCTLQLGNNLTIITIN